jgi:large repetitive protein
MKIRLTMVATAIALGTFGLAAVAPASASTALVVPGTSNPFLAAQPAGSCCSSDSAPAESPVLAGAVTGGSTLTFTDVTGGVSYAGGTPTDGPNGNAGYLIDTVGYEPGPVINGIAGYNNAPVDALVGVFIGSYDPTLTPADLDFSSPTTTPGLQQIFYIGDGSLGGIIAPTGATELYLGTVDGFGWYNNTGAIDVTVNGLAAGVPEPATWAMFLVGFGGIGFMLRNSRRRDAIKA